MSNLPDPPNGFESCRYNIQTNKYQQAMQNSANIVIYILNYIAYSLHKDSFGDYGGAITRPFSEKFIQTSARITGTKTYSNANTQCQCGLFDVDKFNNLNNAAKTYLQDSTNPSQKLDLKYQLYENPSQPIISGLSTGLNKNFGENEEYNNSIGRYANCGVIKDSTSPSLCFNE